MTLVNGGAAALLVAVLAAVALVVNPPAPPGISEFAPQATKPISKAPQDQGAVSGRGPGSSAGCEKPCATPTATGARPVPPPSGHGLVASALQCYTWPDGRVTQTFDPQSPPCVASWPGQAKGNGGVTSPGVTATSIRIAWPTNGLAAVGSAPPTVTPWARFFNAHFTLYGRQLVIVPVKASSATPSDQHAAAVDAADLDVFASLDLASTHGTPGPEFPFFYDDLAKRKVISVTGGGGFTSERAYRTYHPYEWSYLPPQDTLQRATGTMVCRQLVGHAARHSTQFAARTRVFGILVAAPADGSPAPDTTGYRESLATCGVKPRVYEMRGVTGAENTSTFTQLNQAGVTTLLTVNPAGGTGGTAAYMRDAGNAGYFPEWVVPGGLGDQVEGDWAGVRNAETRGLLGLAGWNRRVDTEVSPATQAFGAAGEVPADPTFYDQLQILAAGIQAAGPRLTPATFAAGLQSLDYPNPGAGSAPDYQATVSFVGDHVAIDDYALVWWDTAATSKQTWSGARNPGAFCYVRGARRWRADAFPDQDRFQVPSGAQC